MSENGSKWARVGLIFGVVASIAGNVANAFLTPTSVSILLRIPMALIWPIGLFIAVEVLVRNRKARGLLARIGQAGLLTVTVPTAITSFLNLHALMVKAAEPGIAQLTGPIAIDGLMLGCTIMLLAARVPALAPRPLTVHLDNSAATFTNAVNGAMSYLDRLAAEVDAEPILATPVSGPPAARSNEVSADTVPEDMAKLIMAWHHADRDERPTLKDMSELLAGESGRSTRTVRRWRDALVRS